MKPNTLKILKSIGIFLVILALFYFFLLLIDTQFDRMVGDWFEDTFTFETGYVYSAHQINWPLFKNVGLILCGVIITLWFASLYLTIWITRRRSEKEILRDAGEYLKEYLEADSNSEPIPQKRYKDLMVGISDFKSRMHHNERILKDETSKKNDMIAYLAHDLKTPLTSVVGYLTLLEEAPDMPMEQKARYTHIALQKAQRLEQLINEFFEITRYNLHEIILEKETIDLNYMLIQMTDEFYPVLMEHGNKIEVHAEDNLTIYADPIKIARVFNNILKNAIAYSDPDSTIKITAEKKESDIHLHFSNAGKTIPAGKLQNIFRKFYRLDESRSTGSGGAGLGLAIAKEIVRLHNGKISATSEDGITIFHVILPAK